MKVKVIRSLPLNPRSQCQESLSHSQRKRMKVKKEMIWRKPVKSMRKLLLKTKRKWRK